MVIKQKIIVLGLRKFEGTIDGNKHDFTKLNYCLADNYIDNDKEQGFYTTEIVAGTSSAFEDLRKHKYPSMFDVELEWVQDRKGNNKMELLSTKFLKTISFE